MNSQLRPTPSGLDVEKIDLLRAFGVNRLSLGVQSFQPRLLKILGTATISCLPTMHCACWT